MINYKQYLIYLQVKALIGEFEDSFTSQSLTITTYDKQTNTTISNQTMDSDLVEPYIASLDSSKVTYTIAYPYPSLASVNIICYISENFNIPMDTLRKRLISFKLDTPYLLSPAQFYYLQTGSYSVPTTPEWTA